MGREGQAQEDHRHRKNEDLEAYCEKIQERFPTRYTKGSEGSITVMKGGPGELAIVVNAFWSERWLDLILVESYEEDLTSRARISTIEA